MPLLAFAFTIVFVWTGPLRPRPHKGLLEDLIDPPIDLCTNAEPFLLCFLMVSGNYCCQFYKTLSIFVTAKIELIIYK